MFNVNEKIIENYSKSDLKYLKNLTIKLPASQKTLNNLHYIGSKITIVLMPQESNPIAEEEYYKNCINIIKKLATLNKDFTIQIKVNNREKFRKSDIIKELSRNITLKIDSDEEIYKWEEYKAEEKKLDNMIRMIKYANLSPLEKYLAIYDIVKKYKKYNDNDKHKSEARNLKYILNDDNEYIVCAGFTKLLSELLNRVNISSKYLSLSVDKSYDSQDIRPLKNEKHARNLIKIDDDKYNIHGFYLADSTWDNNENIDSYLNSLMTFDRKKEARRLESLEDVDLLMDFHDIKDFQTKIKYFLKRGTYPAEGTNAINNLKKKTYKDLYLSIMDILADVDYSKYQEFYYKYNDLININLDDIKISQIEIIISNFLNDYAAYIIPLSNNKIDFNVLTKAMIQVKREIAFMNDDEIKDWIEKTNDENAKKESIAFPYIYNPNEKREAYLDTRGKRK